MKLSIILSTLAVFGSTLAAPSFYANHFLTILVSSIRSSIVDIQVVVDHKYTGSGYKEAKKIEVDFHFSFPIGGATQGMNQGKFTSYGDVLDLIKQFSKAMEKTISGAIEVIKLPAMHSDIKKAIYSQLHLLATHFHVPGANERFNPFDDAFRKACPKQTPVFNVLNRGQLSPAIKAMVDAYEKGAHAS